MANTSHIPSYENLYSEIYGPFKGAFDDDWHERHSPVRGHKGIMGLKRRLGCLMYILQMNKR
jgi:hypothetical protein